MGKITIFEQKLCGIGSETIDIVSPVRHILYLGKVSNQKHQVAKQWQDKVGEPFGIIGICLKIWSDLNQSYNIQAKSILNNNNKLI